MEKRVEARGSGKEKAKKEGLGVFEAGEEEDDDEELFDDDKKKRKGSSSTTCCQVENCTADMTDAKRYHRRHKVCVHHSKAPFVVVAGLRQRFCQQCSRFHELLEFDEAKRSCRRRLAGHNERRRKNSAESNAEGSNRRGVEDAPLNENHCRQADQSGIIPISVPGSPTYKHFQIR